MARGFGSTDGSGTTDLISTTYSTDHTLQTWAAWIWITGAGGGNFARLVRNTVEDRILWMDWVAGEFWWTVGFTTFGGQWSTPIPSTGAWHHFAWTYDAGSTANDPLMYIDGSSVTVTEEQAPSGTLLTTGNQFDIGNRRSDSLRNWNGSLAEFAHWSRILSAEEIAALAKGFAPSIFPRGLALYCPLDGRTSPERDFGMGGGHAGTVTGTAYQAHPKIITPGRESIILRTPVVAPTTPTLFTVMCPLRW